MRISPLRTTVALLRKETGLTQKEFAELCGVTAPTVQSLELGRLALSPRLAQRMAQETSVDLAWLLEGNIRKPILALGGGPFTRRIFENTRAARNDGTPVSVTRGLPFMLAPRIHAIGAAAGRQDAAQMFLWRLKQFLAAQEKEFGRDEAAYQQALTLAMTAKGTRTSAEEARAGVPVEREPICFFAFEDKGYQAAQQALLKPLLDEYLQTRCGKAALLDDQSQAPENIKGAKNRRAWALAELTKNLHPTRFKRTVERIKEMESTLPYEQWDEAWREIIERVEGTKQKGNRNAGGKARSV